MKTSDGPNSSEKQLFASARIKDVATVRKPLIQIPSHVFVFSLMMAPVAACYVYYEKNKKSDKELEQILSKDSYYRENVTTSHERRADLQRVFNNMKNPGSDPDLERQMMEALHGGKSDQKRLHPVNQTLYGTEEGVAEKQRAIEESRRIEQERQTKRRKRKEAKARNTTLESDRKEIPVDKKENPTPTMSKGNSSLDVDRIENQKIWTMTGTAVAAMVAVGIIVLSRPR